MAAPQEVVRVVEALYYKSGGRRDDSRPSSVQEAVV